MGRATTQDAGEATDGVERQLKRTEVDSNVCTAARENVKPADCVT